MYSLRGFAVAAIAFSFALPQFSSAATATLGVVTKVDKIVFPTRTTLFWSGQEEFPNIDANVTVYVNGKTYRTIVNSTVGNIYLPTSAQVAVGDSISFAVMPSPSTRKCTFNGSPIAHGTSVTAYKAASGSACVSEKRTCKDGTLSGTFTHAKCTAVTAPLTRPCSFNGRTIPHASSTAAYQAASVAAGSACAKQVRTCADGKLSGSYGFASCTPAAPTTQSCSVSGVTIAHGASRIFYSSASVPFGQTCAAASFNRTCNNGTLSGSATYAHATCAVAAAASCTFGSRTIPHGSSTPAYQAANVPAGQTCTKQTRTCTSGTLSGTFTHAACTVAAPAGNPCTFTGYSAVLREGNTHSQEASYYTGMTDVTQTVASGASISAYSSAHSLPGETCASLKQTRICTNGNLTGTARYKQCVDLPSTASGTTAPFKRSDVLFSPRYKRQVWAQAFVGMKANRIAWTYSGAEYQNLLKGTIPVQDSLNFFSTDPAKMCAGSTPDQWGRVRANPNSNAWRTEALATLKSRIDAGIRVFQQDDPDHAFTACATPAQAGAYYDWLHAQARAYAKSKDPNAKLYFSSNITSQQVGSWVTGHFDFAVSEMFGEATNGTAVWRDLKTMMPIFTAYSHPSAITLRYEGVTANKRAIASAYAFGVLAIAPWDTFYDWGERFYSNPSNYAPYYGMIRANKAVFDDYKLVTTANIDNAAVVTSPAMNSTIRVHVNDAQKKSVHVVNWNSTTASNAVIKLKKSEFPKPPNRIITPENPTPRTLTSTSDATYYSYNVGSMGIWAILYRDDATASGTLQLASVSLFASDLYTNIARGWEELLRLAQGIEF